MSTMTVAPKSGETRLEDVLVRDVMTRDPATVHCGMTAREAGVFLTDRGIGTALVADGGRVVGVLSRADVLSAVAAGAEDTPAEQILSPGVIAVRPDADARQAFTLMTRCELGQVFVADEDGTPVGVVSATDLLRALATRWCDRDAAPAPL